HQLLFRCGRVKKARRQRGWDILDDEERRDARNVWFNHVSWCDETYLDDHWCPRRPVQPFRWCQSLFGQPATPPSHDHFGQVQDIDGTVLLCLHRWGAHEHPSLMSPDKAPPGNGVLLFFRVDDFDMALKRARALVTCLEEE